MDIYEKIASVPSPLKRYRRALALLEEGAHDFHGSGNLAALTESGRIAPGARNTFGHGVYFTQGQPEMAYWKPSFANGPRQGGVIAPREVTRSVPAKGFAPGPGAYRVAPELPLGRDLHMVADQKNPAAVSALRDAQRRFNVKPMALSELETARKVHRGVISEAEGAQRVFTPTEGRSLYEKLYDAIPQGSHQAHALGALERLSNGVQSFGGNLFQRVLAKTSAEKDAIDITPFHTGWRNNMLLSLVLAMGTPSAKKPLSVAPTPIHAVQALGMVRAARKRTLAVPWMSLLKPETKSIIKTVVGAPLL